MIKSFRQLLLVLFLAFSASNIVVYYLSYRYDTSCSEVRELRQRVQHIETAVFRDFKVQTDFFYYERSNPQYYITGASKYIDTHISDQQNIRRDLLSLLGKSNTENFGTDSTIIAILDQLLEHSACFQSMAGVLRAKGFKDYGIEGEMRRYVHQMEAAPEFRLVDVLMLRRHEKDYLLRSDPQYPDKLHRLANEMVIGIERTPRIPSARKDSLRLMVNNYVLAFDKLVRQDNELGLTNNTALKLKLDRSRQALAGRISALLAMATQRENQLLRLMRFYSIALIASVALSSLFVSVWLSRRITARLELLTANMRFFVASGFSQSHLPIAVEANGTDEIGTLIENYMVMREKIIELVHSFKLKVEERTYEISCQRDQLEKQSEEIAAQRDSLADQNLLIEGQRRAAEQHNTELTDSLRYASGIQQAMMPDRSDLSTPALSAHVFYRPLGIISGDYYWLHHTEGGIHGRSLSFFAVADCTGHGVPGALMSMLGITFLNEIVANQKIYNVCEILNALRANVISTMRYRSAGSTSSDGMDIAIGAIDRSTQLLHFAGANRDAHVIRNGEMTVLPGCKMPIGNHSGSFRSFTCSTLALQDGDQIYFFSDGFTDQFGGPSNKKYTKRRFKQFLADLSRDRPFTDHCPAIESELSCWQGANAQIDDITVMGICWKTPIGRITAV